MTDEENYCFDTAGYLILRSALTPAETETCHNALDDAGCSGATLDASSSTAEIFRKLLVHPTVIKYLNEICGPGFRLDRGPTIISSDCENSSRALIGGNEPRDPSQAYYYQNGRRTCQAVHVIWALDEIERGDGGFVLAPCSHKSNVEPPHDLLTGQDDAGLLFQPPLNQGDLLICAESALQGTLPWRVTPRKRLLSYHYAARAAVRSTGTGPVTEAENPLPRWTSELTAEQRAFLYKPGYKASYPPPSVASDGKRCWLMTDSKAIHPSIYRRDPEAKIDEKEFYFWDLRGYLILRNVMTSDHLRMANEAIDRFQNRIVIGDELSRGSKTLAGTGRPLLSGLLTLPKPYCEPFREMLAHPAIVQRLNWMSGSGCHCEGGAAICSVEGTSGHALHTANEPLNPSVGYVFHNGRSYCESVTVAWQLRKVTKGAGGFVCVPGSHKANYRMPAGIRTADDPLGLMIQPSFEAGDVLFFMDGATTHGALPWRDSVPRRAVLFKYQSRNFHRSGGDIVGPEIRWGSLVDGMTDAQLAVMRGPDRDLGADNVPRLSVENATTQVYHGLQK